MRAGRQALSPGHTHLWSLLANSTDSGIESVLQVVIFHATLQRLTSKDKKVSNSQKHNQAVPLRAALDMCVVMILNLTSEKKKNDPATGTGEVVVSLMEVARVQLLVVLTLEDDLRCVISIPQ